MRVSFETKGGFDNIESWLKRTSKHNPTSTLNEIANDGLRALSNATPEDTGDTASGWFYTVRSNGSVSEIAWKNESHPNSEVNVVKLIELGHATRTGGYVRPNPFIKDAMNDIFKKAGNKLAGEMIK